VWREKVSALEPVAAFASPASKDEIQEIERDLSIELPHELRELLAESNGISGRYGGGLVWPADRIAKDNVMFRSSLDGLYMSFNSLLFFADAGNGDQVRLRDQEGSRGRARPRRLRLGPRGRQPQVVRRIVAQVSRVVAERRPSDLNAEAGLRFVLSG
jgi:hypothetical protein